MATVTVNAAANTIVRLARPSSGLTTSDILRATRLAIDSERVDGPDEMASIIAAIREEDDAPADVFLRQKHGFAQMCYGRYRTYMDICLQHALLRPCLNVFAALRSFDEATHADPIRFFTVSAQKELWAIAALAQSNGYVDMATTVQMAALSRDDMVTIVYMWRHV